MSCRLPAAALILAQFLGWACLPAAAQEKPGAEKGALSLLFENDLFYDADRDYTNGVGIAYTTAPADTPQWAIDAAHALPFFTKGGEVRTRYALGQEMFTPPDITRPNPPLTDRPYAGFLYGSIGVVADSGVHLDQLQLTLGMIGPASLADQTQAFVHRIVGSRDPKGWATQLRNEPALVINYERAWKVVPQQSLLGGVFDIEPHYGVAVGNVYDYVNVGAMARFGFNLPKDYGPMRIQPSLPGSDYFEPTADLGAYAFAGVDGRAIGRNLFLDGNSFVASRSVSKMNLVGDVTLGAAITFRAFRLAFSHVIRSREYKTQSTDSNFGAVNLSVRF